jgi:hypothetical protein
MLNGLQLQDRALKVSLAKSGINSGSGAARAPAAAAYGAYPGAFPGAAQPYGMAPPSYGGGGYGAAAGRAPRGTEDPERVSRTVHLTGVDPSINELQLAQFFAGCGPVLAVRIGGDGAQPTKMAWLEFATAHGAAACVSLNGCALGMYPLKIAPSRSAIQNNGLLRFAAQMAAAGLPAPIAPPAPSGGAGAYAAAAFAGAAAAPASAYAASAYAAYAPLVAPPAELACTVHVGGVDVGVSAAELRAFFEDACGGAGSIAKMQYGPPPTMAQPFAIVFLEFTTPAAAQAAMTRSGAALRGGVLRVSPAKSAIVGPGVALTAPAEAPQAAPAAVQAPAPDAGAGAEGEKAADAGAAAGADAEEPAAAAGAKRAREEEKEGEAKAEEAGAAAVEDATEPAEPAAAAAGADAGAAAADAKEEEAADASGAPEKRARRST